MSNPANMTTTKTAAVNVLVLNDCQLNAMKVNYRSPTGPCSEYHQLINSLFLVLEKFFLKQ